MENKYKIVHHKTYDIWILETGEYPEDRYLREGTVIYIGGWLSLEEQIDNLLDLILKKDDKQKYYEEILHRLATEL